MKANELMIGDWVHLKDALLPPLYLKVHSIYPSYIQAEGELGQFRDDTLAPIPLTPEILEKNGFERRDDLVEDGFLPFIIDSLDAEECYEIIVEWKDSYDNGAVDAFNVEAWEESWKLHIGCKMNTYISTADVIFVHELQHAIKLCGIDKEIVL